MTQTIYVLTEEYTIEDGLKVDNLYTTTFYLTYEAASKAAEGEGIDGLIIQELTLDERIR